MTQRSTTSPIVKVRTVPLSPEQAFDLFTVRMGEWWPLATHSIAGSDAVGVRFDQHRGGTVTELTRDGSEHAWADVLEWDPPLRFVLAWHPSINPTAASRLEVRFAAGEGGTTVTLEHSGWEAFGDLGAQLRGQYLTGWEVVLTSLTASAARTSAGATPSD